MSNPHVELSRRFFEEVWNQRRTATIDELLTPESIGHLESGDLPGIDSFKRFHAELLTALPDLHVFVDEIIGEGESVVTRWRATGTHRGDGLGTIATGRPISFSGITWHRYRNGKLHEGWNYWNHLGLLDSMRVSDRQQDTPGGG